MKTKRLVLSLFAGGLLALSSPLWAAFSVNGPQLLDGNGQPFVVRGINYPHAWFTGETNAAIPAIAATGANVVRVVLSNGTHADGWSETTAAEVADIIALAKENELIAMLEVHDVTGSLDSGGGGDSAGSFDEAVGYWLDIQDVLTGEEDYVLINIANEPFGNGVAASTWVDEHVAAIETLRDAGFTHTLVVDAPNWGQDHEHIMLDNASTVFAADSLSNTIFSVHMYEVYDTPTEVEGYIDTFLAEHNVPLIIGEFGPVHNDVEVAVDSILAQAEAMDVGYIGWSWSGNGECCTELDMVEAFDSESLTAWGERLINGENGIAETSETASVFEDDATPAPTSPREPVEVTAPGSNGGGSLGMPFLLILTALAGLVGKSMRWR